MSRRPFYKMPPDTDRKHAPPRLVKFRFSRFDFSHTTAPFFPHAALLDLLAAVLDLLCNGEEKHENGDGCAAVVCRRGISWTPTMEASSGRERTRDKRVQGGPSAPGVRHGHRDHHGARRRLHRLPRGQPSLLQASPRPHRGARCGCTSSRQRVYRDYIKKNEAALSASDSINEFGWDNKHYHCVPLRTIAHCC
jgi:hypothetical protein